MSVRFTNAFTGADTDSVWAQVGNKQVLNSFGGKEISAPLPTAAVIVPAKKFVATAGSPYLHLTTGIASSITVTLPANGQFNAVGYGAVGARRIALIPDDFTPSLSGTYAFRILNASARAGAVDVYIGDIFGVFPDTPQFSAVPIGEATPYFVQPFSTPTLYQTFRVYAAGDHTTVLAESTDELWDTGKYTLMIRNQGSEGDSVGTAMLRDFDPRV